MSAHDFICKASSIVTVHAVLSSLELLVLLLGGLCGMIFYLEERACVRHLGREVGMQEKLQEGVHSAHS